MAQEQRRSSFYIRNEANLRGILAKYRKWLLDDIVPFWEKRVVDKEFGGYFNCFNREGELIKTVKPGWFVGRDLYTFSLLYNEIDQKKEWLDIATTGRKVFDTEFLRPDYRCNQMLSRELNATTGFTSLFTDHFAVKGLYEYIKASGNKNDISLAEKMSEQVFKDSYDNEVLCETEQVQLGTVKHPVSFMTLIVAIESNKVFASRYLPYAKDSVERILDVFANDKYQALFESVNENGTPYLDGYGRIFDAGHSMESVWFCIKAAEIFGNKDYYRKACEILDWVWDKTYDDENGGFFTHVDVLKTVPEKDYIFEQYYDYPVYWDDKIWWTHAEALNAHISAALYGENEKYLQRFKEISLYIESHFSDKEYGEWYSTLDRKGNVKVADKGSELKGPYHVPRCMIHVIRTIELYLTENFPIIN